MSTRTNCRAIQLSMYCWPAPTDALAKVSDISLQERLPDDRRGPAAAHHAYYCVSVSL